MRTRWQVRSRKGIEGECGGSVDACLIDRERKDGNGKVKLACPGLSCVCLRSERGEWLKDRSTRLRTPRRETFPFTDLKQAPVNDLEWPSFRPVRLFKFYQLSKWNFCTSPSRTRSLSIDYYDCTP